MFVSCAVTKHSTDTETLQKHLLHGEQRKDAKNSMLESGDCCENAFPEKYRIYLKITKKRNKNHFSKFMLKDFYFPNHCCYSYTKCFMIINEFSMK